MTETRIEFGTDGIRGIAGEFPLDPTTVLHIGRAIGTWLQDHNNTASTPCAIIGRDTRISGDYLLNTLMAGLLAEGIDVADASIITTPGIAYLTRTYGFNLGIVISASHNPFNQNGIKLFGSDGFKLNDDDEAAIETLIAQMQTAQPAKRFGKIDPFAQGASPYIGHLTEGYDAHTLEELTIVLDCANGAASQIAFDAFNALGTKNLIPLNAEPDGKNINVEGGSEFVRRNRAPILSAIHQHNADLGIAFDGDADRVVLVTPDGTLIDGDHIIGILAVAFKSQDKLVGNTVVATDMSNSGLEHFLTDHGITLHRTKVGDRYVMERMRSGAFMLGGEQAGHIILLDENHTSGDGIHIALLVAALVAENQRQGGPTLDELVARIPRYPQVIASAHLHRQVNLNEVAGLEVAKHEALTKFTGKGRVNMRFSGTEPNLLRAMVEGGPHTSMIEVIECAKSLCRLVAGAAQTPAPVIDLVDCATGAPVEC